MWSKPFDPIRTTEPAPLHPALEAIVFEEIGVSLMQTVADSTRDRALTRRLHLLSKFVTHDNLDAPALAGGPGASSFFSAVEAFRKMHTTKSPRAKVACLAAASRSLCDSLQQHQTAAGEAERPVGADDLLPCMILAVLRANPPWLHTDLQFIEVYTDPDLLVGEAGYLLTQV